MLISFQSFTGLRLYVTIYRLFRLRCIKPYGFFFLQVLQGNGQLADDQQIYAN